jgi:hypothetical protein
MHKQTTPFAPSTTDSARRPRLASPARHCGPTRYHRSLTYRHLHSLGTTVTPLPSLRATPPACHSRIGANFINWASTAELAGNRALALHQNCGAKDKVGRPDFARQREFPTPKPTRPGWGFRIPDPVPPIPPEGDGSGSASDFEWWGFGVGGNRTSTHCRISDDFNALSTSDSFDNGCPGGCGVWDCERGSTTRRHIQKCTLFPALLRYHD